MGGFGQVLGGFGHALADQAKERSPLLSALYARYKRPGDIDPTAPPPGSTPSFDDQLTNPGGVQVESMAHGKMISAPQMGRLGERGPEAVKSPGQGVKLVTSPVLAKLQKGDTVIPLNHSAQNKISPDLLEGHVSAPKVPGVRYSRYRSFVDRAL